MLTIKNETFEGTFPFPPQYHTVNGFAMHFVDVGNGEPLVLLHGDPTWGYLYRHFIPPLAQHVRCIVPDHMGMDGFLPPDFACMVEEHLVFNHALDNIQNRK